jgi:hypothetical protein
VDLRLSCDFPLVALHSLSLGATHGVACRARELRVGCPRW